MTRPNTHRMLIAVLLASGALLSACEEPQVHRSETVTIETETPPAVAAEDVAVPAAAEAPAADAPPPVDTLPPEKRTSEESVQPESETLFY